ncbi:MAG: rRNA maturation RNase YbeY [Bacteroidota bacterium]
MKKIKIIGAKQQLNLKEEAIKQLFFLAKSEGYKIDKLIYNFVDKDKMYALNTEYLKHKTDTDIITFDYSELKKIKAEVYISESLMIENAANNSQSVENELLRLLSHALLHCMGYTDKTKQEKAIMRKKEEEFIFAVSRET